MSFHDPLSEFGAVILDAVVKHDLAVIEVERLDAAVGMFGGLLDELAELESSGWLATWEEWPGGIAATLTPRAAAFLDVRLIEVGKDEEPRWAMAGQPDPPLPRAGRWYMSRTLATLEVEDPSPAPLEGLISAEDRPKLASVAEKFERAGAWPDARREAEREAAAKRRRKAKARAKRRVDRCTPCEPQSRAGSSTGSRHSSAGGSAETL